MSSLLVNELSVAYSSKNVLKKVTFSQEGGEVIVILGASGDGKTTLLKAIAGLVERSHGKISFDGAPILDPSEKLIPGNDRIKLVNQDFNLEEFHTVQENIRLRLLAFNQEYQQQRINELLRVTGLVTFRDQRAKDLSGGQRQRLAIARALADEPDLVLLDEPFNQLDFQTKNKIERHIKSYLKKYGIGVIMVTHNGLEAMDWADRILLLEKGKIVRDASPSAFYSSPRSVKEARFFGELNRITREDEVIFFRPSFFKEVADELHHLEIKVEFRDCTSYGWYKSFRFKCGAHIIHLYSVEDISHLKQVYIRKTTFND